MLNRIARVALSRQRRDAGDMTLTAVLVLIVAAMFITFVLTTASAIASHSKRNQRASIAQEAVDVALAQAMYTLNEDYGVLVDPDGTGPGGPVYESSAGAYNRTLPSERTPATADLTEFNATKETSFHTKDETGKYGIQAEARWWVDLYDVTTDDGTTGNQNRLRKAGQVGDLYVESYVRTADGLVTYGSRAVKVPLHQLHARAVKLSSDGRGLRYVVSPLSLFQFSAFGTEGVEDDRTGSTASVLTPIATSGNGVFANPVATFGTTAAQVRRFDSNLVLFGNGNCIATTEASTCEQIRTVNTGFEIEPDTKIIEDFSQYCASRTTEDFRASAQTNASLTAGDVTYCFNDFIMDADVRLVPQGTGRQVVRVFVSGDLRILNGSRFLTSAGATLHSTAASAPQIALYTDSTNVEVQGALPTGANKFYLYAPVADCSPGAIPDNPVTGADESDYPRSQAYYGSFVCRNVYLEDVRTLSNQTPFPELTEFTAAGFGADIYPNNIWFINTESTEFVSRRD